MNVNVLLLSTNVVNLRLLLLCGWYFLLSFYLAAHLMHHIALDKLLLLLVSASVHFVLVVDPTNEAGLLA